MKKIIVSLFIVLALISFVSPAFALDCKNGNYGSDQCWTNAQLVTNDVGRVVAGTVMVYDFSTGINEGNSADNAAFYVRTASSADQGVYVAGVAQQSYSSGDRMQLLVHGQGKLRVRDTTVSGDRIYVYGGTTLGTRGEAGKTRTFSTNDVWSNDNAIAFSLQGGTAATQDAYIVIV